MAQTGQGAEKSLQVIGAALLYQLIAYTLNFKETIPSGLISI